MATAKAILNNLRTSPRKARLVADYMRGKGVDEAVNSLRFLDKRAAQPLMKLLNSAVANAKNLDIPTERLFIKEITVNSGATLFRRKAGTRGRAMPIRKKTSKISIVLDERAEKASKKAKAAAVTDEKPVKAEKAPAKKRAAKKNEDK